jgi:hypothetical protein
VNKGLIILLKVPVDTPGQRFGIWVDPRDMETGILDVDIGFMTID